MATGKNSEKDQKLLDAAEKGDFEAVKAALAQDADANAKEQKYDDALKFMNGETALNYACKNGNFEIVKLLVEKGADMDLKGVADKTPLMNACLPSEPTEGHDKILKYLIEKNARVSDDLLSSVQLKVNILAENAESGMVLPEGLNAWRIFLNYLIAARVKQDIPETVKRFSESDVKIKHELAYGLSRSASFGMDIGLAVSGLEKAVADSDKDVRFFASLALCLQHVNKKNLKELEKLSKNLDIQIKLGVACGLLESAKNGMDVGFAKEVLSRLANDDEEEIKAAVVAALEILEAKK